MSPVTINKCRGRFRESEIDDETVLMQIDTGEFFSLQGTGRTIWRLIDQTPDRDALLDALATQFDVPRGTLADDVDAFVKLLARAGFVTAH